MNKNSFSKIFLLYKIYKLYELYKLLYRNFYFTQNVAQDLFGFAVAVFDARRMRADDDAVCKTRKHEAFNVVGNAEIASFDQGESLRRPK